MTALAAGLTSALETGLGAGYKVIGFPSTIDGITKPTVALWATKLQHLPAAPNGHFQVDFTVQLLTPHQDPAKADEALGSNLSDLLAVLWNLEGYLLDSAERTVSEDSKIHSWTLTVRGGITITEG